MVPPCLSRRALMLGALSTLAASASRGQTAKARRIDFHHHFAPPRWVSKMAEGKTVGYQQFRGYTPAKSLEAMDRAEVETALISCTAPGVWFGKPNGGEFTGTWTNEDARAMAREVNDFGARMVSDYKGRFGLLAVLHPPDVDGSLREIEYAFDTLKAVGVGLLTSYGNRWLGDEAFKPVIEELNRRKAVVYTHPTDAPCCQNLLPGVGATVLEYNTDTTRAIVSLLYSGRAAACPDIRFVFSHGGGTIPYLVERLGIAPLEKLADALAGTPEPGSRLWLLRRFYYDTAQSANPIQMQALKAFAGSSQIVFGTDFPYTTIVDHVHGLEKSGFTGTELQGIFRENALRFVPRLT